MISLTSFNKRLLLLPALFSLLCCNRPGGPDEGVIYYDVTFPFLGESVLVNVFPEELVVSFKDNEVRGTLRAIGGIVTTEFIADNEELLLYQVLKSFQEKSYCKLSENEVVTRLGEMPVFEYQPTDEVEMVAGIPCKVTIAKFTTDSMPPIRLLHTDALGLENPNWFTQYHEIEDVLLGYEIEHFGMRMKLTARKFENIEISEKEFEIDVAYKQVSPNEMDQLFTGLMDEFTDQP